MSKKVVRLLTAFMLMIAPFASVPLARAAADTCTWTGLGGDSNWSTAANWGDGGGPVGECDGSGVPENGDTILFPSGASQLSNSNDIVGLVLNRIDIDGNGYNITGNDIDITPTAALGMTINGSNNDFGINTTWNGASSLSLSGGGDDNEISGDIDLNLTGGADMNIGTGSGLTLSITGVVSGSTDGIIAASDGVVSYEALNTYTASGVVQINEGATLRCSTDTCLGDSANQLTMYGNAELVFPGVVTLSNPIDINSGTDSPTLIEAQDSVIFNGDVNFNADTEVTEVNPNPVTTSVTFQGSANNIDTGVQVDFVGDGNYLTSYFYIENLTGDGTLSTSAGEVEFGANPLFDGDIIIGSDGYLNTPGGTNLGTTAGDTFIESGGVLRNGLVGLWTSAENYVFEGTGNTFGAYNMGAIDNEGEDMIFTGSVTIADATTFYNEAATYTIDFAGMLAGTGDLTLMDDGTSGGYEITGTATSTYNGEIQVIGASLDFAKTGGVGTAGNLHVEATGTDTAVLSIQNTAGNQIADNATLHFVSDPSNDAIFGSAKTDEVIGTITGDGNIYVTGAGQGFTIGGGDLSGSFTGLFTNTTPSTITKTGSGTWDISGATYGGVAGQGPTITVSSGSVVWGGSLGDINTSVGSGATLKGTGTAGAVTVNSGGTINVGNSPGCMTVSTLNLNNGGIFTAEIAGATACTQHDRVTVTGAANITGATLSVVSTATPADNSVLTLITAGSLTGTFSGLADGATVTANGVTYRINYTATTVTLTKIAGSVTTNLQSTGQSAVVQTFIGISMITLVGALTRRRA